MKLAVPKFPPHWDLARFQGYTTYILGTVWDGHTEHEDTELDLVKIGESTVAPNRIRDLTSGTKKASGLDIRLLCTIAPMKDYVAQGMIPLSERRWEQARELGLPAAFEWYRGGAELAALWPLVAARRNGAPLEIRFWTPDGWRKVA